MTPQEREIMTACVLVSLGPTIRSKAFSVAAEFQKIISVEIQNLEKIAEPSSEDAKFLALLKEAYSAPASLEGIRKLESISTRVDIPRVIPIMQKCWKTLPSVFQFSGFASLIKHNAVSKFITFAQNWKYTGKGYEMPKGMAAPFSGYDDIIQSLMGHPRAKAKMATEKKKWEEYQKKK